MVRTVRGMGLLWQVLGISSDSRRNPGVAVDVIRAWTREQKGTIRIWERHEGIFLGIHGKLCPHCFGSISCCRLPPDIHIGEILPPQPIQHVVFHRAVGQYSVVSTQKNHCVPQIPMSSIMHRREQGRQRTQKPAATLLPKNKKRAGFIQAPRSRRPKRIPARGRADIPPGGARSWDPPAQAGPRRRVDRWQRINPSFFRSGGRQ